MRSKWLRGLFAVVVALASVYTLLTLLARPAADHSFFAAQPRPLVIAHQGGDGLWPGNTLYAFERAAAMGVDVLEMDMHRTADGALVVIHDRTVDRTTDGAGAIAAMSLAEIKQLDAGYDWSPDNGRTFPFRGQGIAIPTLNEIFERFPEYRMNIEIKPDDPAVAEALCALISDYAMTERALVASFHTAPLQAFRRACPTVATSAPEDEVRTFFVLQTLFLDATFSPPGYALQVPEYGGGLHILTSRFVAAAQSRNLEVHAWTINEVEAMQRMHDLGVDGIITDYPDRLLDLLGRN